MPDFFWTRGILRIGFATVATGVRIGDYLRLFVRPFPDDVLRLLKSHTQDIVNELSETDPAWKKIAESYYAFLEGSTENQRVTELANLNTRIL